MKDIDGLVTKDNLYRLISNIRCNPEFAADDRTCGIIVKAIANMPCEHKKPSAKWLQEAYIQKTNSWVAICSDCRSIVESKDMPSSFNYCPRCGVPIKKSDIQQQIEGITRQIYDNLGLSPIHLNGTTATGMFERETYKRLYGHYPEED